jgi:riboflavin-specific deaminase-like protein
VLLRRLHPEPGETRTPTDAIAGLGLADLAPPDRPYVIDNMVATIDGKTTIAGRSGPIGSDVDREVFLELRTQVDAVLAGTGTLRVERYGRLLRSEERRAKREREGLAPDPLAVVVSRSLDVPFDIPLFQDPAQEIALFTASAADPPEVPATLHVSRLEEHEMVGLAAVLRRLRAEHGVRSVLCEGGPIVNGALLRDRVLDELFLTVAPILSAEIGGREIVEAAGLSGPVRGELVWLWESHGELFARYRMETSGDPDA